MGRQALGNSRLVSAIALAPILPLCYGLRALGLPLLGATGAGLGWLLEKLNFRKAIVRANLELALGNELSERDREALTHQIYRSLGQTFLGIARNFALTKMQMTQDLRLSEADRARVQQLLDRGKGAIFISAHLSNWELLAQGMAAHGFPVAIVVKKMSSPVSQALIERQRRRIGLEVIYAGGTIEKMKDAFRRGRAVGFMVDQNITGQRGIRCNFFGVPAASIRALAKLVRDSGAAVIPICSYRQPDGTQTVTLLPELPYLFAAELPLGSEERELREEWLNAQQYQAAIEAMVRKHPEQWMWVHRRWKASRAPLTVGAEHRENRPETARGAGPS